MCHKSDAHVKISTSLIAHTNNHCQLIVREIKKYRSSFVHRRVSQLAPIVFQARKLRSENQPQLDPSKATFTQPHQSLNRILNQALKLRNLQLPKHLSSLQVA